MKIVSGFIIVLVSLGIALIISFGIMEWHLSRIAYKSPPITWEWIIGNTTQTTEFDTDNTLIFRTKKNIPGETNSMGFRMDTDNIDSTNLILAIGDSFTYGDFVQREHAYPQQLTKILSSQGFPYTVVNAGVNSYGPEQELELTKQIILTDHLRPQIVVWQLFQNDLIDMIKHPLYIPFKGRVIRIPAWINSTYITKKIVRTIPRFLAQYKTTHYLIYQFSQINVASFAINDDRRSYQQKKFKFLLQEMDTLARTYKFKLLVVLTPHQGVLHRNPKDYADYLFMKGLLEEQKNITYLDLHQSLARFYTTSEVLGISTDKAIFNSDEIEYPNYSWKHLTKEGNLLVAHAIYSELLRNNLLQKNRSTVPQP